MKRFLVIFAVLLMAGGTYAGSAFLAAWEIREAVRTGNTATLERRVEWDQVRASLKRSAGEARAVITEYSEASAAALPKPGLWQRIKTAAAGFVTDPLIDRYVSAEGAPRLWALRETWRGKVRPIVLSEPPTVLAGTVLAGTAADKALSIARRVDKVAFTSPFRMELEIRDRYVEERRWRAVLELKGQTWTLTEVHVHRTDQAAAAASAVAPVQSRSSEPKPTAARFAAPHLPRI